MTDPIPSDAGIVATIGTQPENVFVKALEDAAGNLKTALGRQDVRTEIISGIFSFLGKEFPAAAVVLGLVEPMVLHLASIGAT